MINKKYIMAIVLTLSFFSWSLSASPILGKLTHTVYYKLKDASEKEQAKLIKFFQEYLQNTPGLLYFAAGRRVTEIKYSVSDLDFHVALNMVFDSKTSLDTFQKSQKHDKFVKLTKYNWEKIRVFNHYNE